MIPFFLTTRVRVKFDFRWSLKFPKLEISLKSPTHEDFITCICAAGRIGAVVTPMNPLYKSDELLHQLKASSSVYEVGTAKHNSSTGKLNIHTIGHLDNQQDINLKLIEEKDILKLIRSRQQK